MLKYGLHSVVLLLILPYSLIKSKPTRQTTALVRSKAERPPRTLPPNTRRAYIVKCCGNITCTGVQRSKLVNQYYDDYNDPDNDDDYEQELIPIPTKSPAKKHTTAKKKVNSKQIPVIIVNTARVLQPLRPIYFIQQPQIQMKPPIVLVQQRQQTPRPQLAILQTVRVIQQQPIQPLYVQLPALPSFTTGNFFFDLLNEFAGLFRPLKSNTSPNQQTTSTKAVSVIIKKKVTKSEKSTVKATTMSIEATTVIEGEETGPTDENEPGVPEEGGEGEVAPENAEDREEVTAPPDQNIPVEETSEKREAEETNEKLEAEETNEKLEAEETNEKLEAEETNEKLEAS